MSQDKDKVGHCSVTESITLVKKHLHVSQDKNEVEHIPAVVECETNYIFKKKLPPELLSLQTRRARLPWRAKNSTMEGRGNEAPHLGFGFRGYSRTSQLGSLQLAEADNRSMLSNGMISELGGQTSRGTGRSKFALPQSHAPLPRRTPQPQLMLPLRDHKICGQSQHGDSARGEAFCLEGEQLIKPSGKKAEKNSQAKGQHISGYYRDALLRRGATLRPIAAGAFSSRLVSVNAPTDVRSMMVHMSSVSDYVTTEFGFNPERARDEAALSAQRFTNRDSLLHDVASSANKHIYVTQNSHMLNRNSRADDGIQNVRKTLYPFMEQRQERHAKGTVSYRAHDPVRPLLAAAAGSRDLPIYDKQLWKRQSQQPKRAIRTERKSPIVLPPINVSKVSLTKDSTD